MARKVLSRMTHPFLSLAFAENIKPFQKLNKKGEKCLGVVKLPKNKKRFKTKAYLARNAKTAQNNIIKYSFLTFYLQQNKKVRTKVLQNLDHLWQQNEEYKILQQLIIGSTKKFNVVDQLSSTKLNSGNVPPNVSPTQKSNALIGKSDKVGFPTVPTSLKSRTSLHSTSLNENRYITQATCFADLDYRGVNRANVSELNPGFPVRGKAASWTPGYRRYSSQVDNRVFRHRLLRVQLSNRCCRFHIDLKELTPRRLFSNGLPLRPFSRGVNLLVQPRRGSTTLGVASVPRQTSPMRGFHLTAVRKSMSSTRLRSVPRSTKLNAKLRHCAFFRKQNRKVTFLFPLTQLKLELSKKQDQYRSVGSDYKLRLLERKKCSLLYGNLVKKHFQKTREQALQGRGKGGGYSRLPENFLSLLESRLDVVLYRIFFCETISAARHLIARGKVTVNGVVTRKWGGLLKPGDVCSIINTERKKTKNQILRKLILAGISIRSNLLNCEFRRTFNIEIPHLLKSKAVVTNPSSTSLYERTIGSTKLNLPFESTQRSWIDPSTKIETRRFNPQVPQEQGFDLRAINRNLLIKRRSRFFLTQTLKKLLAYLAHVPAEIHSNKVTSFEIEAQYRNVGTDINSVVKAEGLTFRRNSVVKAEGLTFRRNSVVKAEGLTFSPCIYQKIDIFFKCLIRLVQQKLKIKRTKKAAIYQRLLEAKHLLQTFFRPFSTDIKGCAIRLRPEGLKNKVVNQPLVDSPCQSHTAYGANPLEQQPSEKGLKPNFLERGTPSPLKKQSKSFAYRRVGDQAYSSTGKESWLQRPFLSYAILSLAISNKFIVPQKGFFVPLGKILTTDNFSLIRGYLPFSGGHPLFDEQLGWLNIGSAGLHQEVLAEKPPCLDLQYSNLFQFLRVHRFLYKERTRRRVKRGYRQAPMKPLHLEVSYTLLTAIFLYYPQKLVFPGSLDLALVFRELQS